MNSQRGQVSITVAVITGVGMIVASALTGWGTSSTGIAVVQERENNHYLETRKDLARIETKFDDQAKDIKGISEALHVRAK